MIVRLAGAIFFVLGTFVAIFASWGLLSATSMVSDGLVESGPIDARQWSTSWKLSSVLLILIGLSTAVAGIVVTTRRAWGFLLLASAATVTSVFPWILLAAGRVRYAFEVPKIGETAIGVAVAACSIAAFLRCRRHWPTRDR